MITQVSTFFRNQNKENTVPYPYSSVDFIWKLGFSSTVTTGGGGGGGGCRKGEKPFGKEIMKLCISS